MSLFLYNAGLFFYRLGIQVAAPFYPKAKQWIQGRKDLINSLRDDLATQTKPIVWFHCASLGEYEQACPLIAAYKTQRPEHAILLTFFSPSGYRSFNGNLDIDHVSYLPLDSRSNAHQFIETVQPIAAFFIKYEFWYHYLNQLRLKNIKTYLVSARFLDKQLFFKSYGSFYRGLLPYFTHIFLQDHSSKDLLETIGITKTSVTGDTRVDQVIINKETNHPKKDRIWDAWMNSSAQILVCGSTWPADEKLLAKWYKSNPEWHLIIAPHEVNKSHIDDLRSLFDFAKPILFSSLSNNASISKTNRVLILDSIGQLKYLYRHGHAAYIGGGFGKGIHNILEAIVYHIPVFFGPNHTSFKEANDLIQKKLAFNIENDTELTKNIAFAMEPKRFKELQIQIAEYIEHSRGASQRIMNVISTTD